MSSRTKKVKLEEMLKASGVSDLVRVRKDRLGKFRWALDSVSNTHSRISQAITGGGPNITRVFEVFVNVPHPD